MILSTETGTFGSVLPAELIAGAMVERSGIVMTAPDAKPLSFETVLPHAGGAVESGEKILLIVDATPDATDLADLKRLAERSPADILFVR